MLCLDASFLLNVLVDRLHAEDAERWRRWLDERRPMVAPRLLHYETVSILHKWRRNEKLTEPFVQRTMRTVVALPIQIVDDAMTFEALSLARDHGLLSSYDAHYLAVALRHGADLWTSDGRLHERTRSRLPWVHYAPEDVGQR